jgi:transposase
MDKKVMAGWRRPIELAVNDAEVAALEEISRSRSEPVIRVERARILLAYRESLSFFAVGRTVGVHHQTVQRCVKRAAVEGPMAALDERPRPGKAPTITAEAKAWIKDLACRKAKELAYPHELWTTRLLASLDLAIDTQNLSHLPLELRVAAFQVIAHLVGLYLLLIEELAQARRERRCTRWRSISTGPSGARWCRCIRTC